MNIMARARQMAELPVSGSRVEEEGKIRSLMEAFSLLSFLM